MFDSAQAFSGFSVDDIPTAKQFYSETLGLNVSENAGMLRLHLAAACDILVYPKPDHRPATFTILNFPVDDIDKAVEELAERGVELINYDSPQLPQDGKGVLRGLSQGIGPDIAWFMDPAGNVLAVLQEK